MNRVIRQIIRGCGSLPHVGEHPGTGLVVIFVTVTGVIGANASGVLGAVCGALFAAAAFGPAYFHGAYKRAQLSDDIEQHRKRIRAASL